MSDRRFPLDALVLVSGLTEAQLARRVGMDGTALKRARLRGLTEEAADRYATRAGLHPCNVWPDFADDVLDDVTRVCAAQGCDATFVLHLGSGGGNRRFCSDRCQGRESMRRYRSTERGREANRRITREYKQYLRTRREAS